MLVDIWIVLVITYQPRAVQDKLPESLRYFSCVHMLAHRQKLFCTKRVVKKP